MSAKLHPSRSLSARGRRGDGCTVLQGRLLPVKDGEVAHKREESDPDDSDGDDPQFMDAREIEGGGMVVQSTPLRRTVVIIKDKYGPEYRVSGFFPLVDPWWSVKLKVKRDGTQYFAQGYPSYALENDMSKDILSLFLHACKVHDDTKQTFINWLPSDATLTFDNLKKLIEEFQMNNSSNKINIESSGPGLLVMQALECPLTLKYLPKLLPRKVKGIFFIQTSESSEDPKPQIDLLKEIETILASEPWKFGFQCIIYRALKLCRCEATWGCFLQCKKLLAKMTELQKNALLIYNELKDRCREIGDTYAEQEVLTKLVSGQMPAEDAWEAIKFLKDNCIVVLEGQRVFLQNLYLYEKDIARYISALVNGTSWKLDFDAKEILASTKCFAGEENSKLEFTADNPGNLYKDDGPPSQYINTLQITDGPASTDDSSAELDIDQLNAVSMICSNPITVISGKGGCGKTTVVSLVFKHMIKKENMEIEEACKALEGDLDASEEWNRDQMACKEECIEPVHILLTAPTGKAASLLKKKTGLPAATLHQVTCSYSAWRKQNSDKPWKFSKVKALVVDEGSLVSVNIFSTALKFLCNNSDLAKLIILGDVRQLPSIEPGNLLADIFTSLGNKKWVIELRTNHRAESQLIVDNATRRDCMMINELCSRHYSEHSIKNHKNKFDFQVKDKVCCTKNAYVKDLKTKNTERLDLTQSPGNRHTINCEEAIPSTAAWARNRSQAQSDSLANEDERLCNGEIFFITDDVERDKIRELTLRDSEDREYTLNYKALRRCCGLTHAWARTIHTFQGSEEETVVYVLGSAGRQNWKHVYTAVTRGRKRVYIVAKLDQLGGAIANKARDRKTRLQQRLKETLTQNRDDPGSGKPIGGTQVQCVSNADHEDCNREQKFKILSHHSPTSPGCSVPSTAPPNCEVPSTSTNHTEGNLASEDFIHSLQQSPSQKRPANISEGPGTPAKLSRVAASKENMSPLGCSRLQNLSLGCSSPKQLFKP
uniref:DNA helicase B n=1 Tax=Xenopus tropicalis TaxID=8364 RepID=A0A6I8RNG1_XENTR